MDRGALAASLGVTEWCEWQQAHTNPMPILECLSTALQTLFKNMHVWHNQHSFLTIILQENKKRTITQICIMLRNVILKKIKRFMLEEIVYSLYINKLYYIYTFDGYSIHAVSCSLVLTLLQQHMDWPVEIAYHRFSGREFWSGRLLPSPGDLPNPRFEPKSPGLQADSLPLKAGIVAQHTINYNHIQTNSQKHTHTCIPLWGDTHVWSLILEYLLSSSAVFTIFVPVAFCVATPSEHLALLKCLLYKCTFVEVLLNSVGNFHVSITVSWSAQSKNFWSSYCYGTKVIQAQSGMW